MHVVDTILTQTAEVFQRTPAELLGRSRKHPIVLARQAAMWAIRQRYPSLSLEVIGTALGGRHYSTVMHGLAAVEQRAQDNTTYREQLQQLIARVSSSSRHTHSSSMIEQSGETSVVATIDKYRDTRAAYRQL
jgi:Bacterial dnaA protein helix-turn-helix